ncbi:MAG: hypothetical protein V5A25_05830 [Halovenus sp.]
MGTRGNSDAGSSLPGEVWEEVMDSDRRRSLLAHLAAEEDPVAVTDLAAVIARGEEGVANSDSIRAIRTDLFQRHLPKLNATGVVRYDSKLGTVELAVSLPEEYDLVSTESLER